MFPFYTQYPNFQKCQQKTEAFVISKESWEWRNLRNLPALSFPDVETNVQSSGLPPSQDNAWLSMNPGSSKSAFQSWKYPLVLVENLTLKSIRGDMQHLEWEVLTVGVDSDVGKFWQCQGS